MDWRLSRLTRHHNFLTSAAPITGPIIKKGGGRTVGKRIGRVVGGGGPDFSSVVLLSGFEGADGSTSFSDESTYARTMTPVGNAQIDTSQFKFGSSSAQFDGSGDWVTMASASEFNFGYNAFTIDLFFRLNDTSDRQGLLTKFRLLGSNVAWFAYMDSSTPRFAISTGANTRLGPPNTAGVDVASSSTVSAGTWYHLRADRTAADPATGGSVLRLYLDGVMVGKEATGPANNGSNVSIGTGTTAQVWLGGINNNSGEWPLDGHLDEVRVFTGEALCADDAGFTIPTEAYPRA